MINDVRVLSEARRAYDQTRPQRRVVDGLTIVTYSRTRVHLDRDAWEMLPADGVLLMRVRPTGQAKYALALTKPELEHVFGEIKTSDSWKIHRYWTFPTAPPAARAFLVQQPQSPGVRTAVPSPQPPLDSAPQAANPPRQARPKTSTQIVAAPDGVSADFNDWATWWYDRFEVPPEAPDYLKGVSDWRNVWRPNRVRAVLIAESHVAEHPGDLRARVNAGYAGLTGLPTQYVRLVYCLGYGEPEICMPRPRHNAGTIQYWDILGQVAHGQDQPRKSRSSLRDRLRWKVSVLRELQQRGIWLQDASPLGIYRGSAGRLDARLQLSVLRDGYKRWVWPSVQADNPEKVWVIGAGVASALAGLPGIDQERTIMQPQGDRTAPGRHREGLNRMARDLRGHH